ncbi:Uncharacterised protein [Amycolatopsis camponoti]|uniref:GPP34 family phosphoprotein n=1 Tax=Amycolatopsis camponoti TaxID=2606593 RepID=A0A6I8LYX3_9PSEU|nr:GPP34 family phosphoprotein [Amycolatopsis camponoti]VVJ22656.1 Uncharacterised protein [Amycolatopsis camponoti]
MKALRFTVSRYHGSDRLASVLLTAPWCRDSNRPLVHDDDRIACVVGCMLLLELYFDGNIGVDAGGRIRPVGTTSDDDPALKDLLTAIRGALPPRPALSWLHYLTQQHRAITMVWQRLVDAGVAAPAEKRRWRSRPRRVMTELLATAWAPHYLSRNVTVDDAIPQPAIALWHGLKALRLDARALEMDLAIGQRLDATPLPAELQPLFSALNTTLARLATPL